MKDVAWGVIHGEGTIVCTCDQCGRKEEYPFDDGYPDFRSFQKKLNCMGWKSAQIFGEWKDFCGESCRNAYIKNNT